MNTRSPQGRQPRPTSAEVRSRLLDAAEALLAERRPASITSRDIAGAAGLSVGVLYNHFADKNELLLAALVRRFDRLTAAYVADPVEPGHAPIEIAFAEVVRRAHAIQVAVLPLLANLVSDPPLLQRFLVEIHRAPLGGELFHGPIRRYLEAERASGRLGDFDIDAATDLVVGVVLHQGLIGVLDPHPDPARPARLEAITRTLLNGLLPPGGTRS